jgi:hypothetical protein
MPNTIICPKCKTEIEVTEALSSQLRDELRQQFEAEAQRKEQDFLTREDALKKREASLATAQQSIDQQVQAKLTVERQRLSDQAMALARESVALELKGKEEELTQTKTKLREAQQAELDVRRRAQQLDEQKRELDLTLARKLDQEREKIREAAKKEAAEERALKEAEKDKLIGDLTRQINDLKRKSEQGSQQAQGEVMELELEGLLRREFPYDDIVPVPKGVHGGDVLQHVRDSAGCPCGTVLWESKRTKAWSDGWLPKLRDDQRAAKAQIAALATLEMPKGLSTFGCVDGVWVTSRPCLLGLASALRSSLIEVAVAKRALQGHQGKMEILYNYLSGSEFRHRVEGIVEAFVALSTDLEKEKAAMQRIWAKRQKQIERAVANTVGLHGDFSGIIGSSLPQIEKLELPAIAADAADDPAELRASESPD